MALKQYKAKRDFTRTSEPAGKEKSERARSVRSQGAAPFFVVQKHAARRLHYDFRLEMEGVLKSWAVPKGVPFAKGDRRLAVQVEDHPIEYADFEGIIAEGNYGAGTVMVWDRGVYDTFGDEPVRALENGKIHLRLSGEKLKGEWTLVRLRGSKNGDKNEWLLLKTGADAKPVSARREDQSVVSKRTLKQIAAAADAEWQSNRPAASARVEPRTTTAPPRRSRAQIVSATMQVGRLSSWEQLPALQPGFIEPMKCLLVQELPRGVEWIHEIKFDGYRALAVKHGGDVSLFSRNHKDFTRRYPTVTECLENVAASEAVIDGEVVALDENGRPSFQLLQAQQSVGNRPPVIAYYAFDLLQLDGRDLRGLPLVERKEALERIIAGLPDCVRYSAGLQADPKRLVDEMQARGLEGVIAKKRHSKYESGRRSGAWVKFKWAFEQEFVIGGYTAPEGMRSHLGAILVGYYEGERLMFASKVGTGFDEKTLADLYKRFQGLRRTDPPFANIPEKRSGRSGQGLSAAEMRRCTWIEPKLVCQVRFTEWTRDNHLRHPVFLGLRDDKEAKEVGRE